MVSTPTAMTTIAENSILESLLVDFSDESSSLNAELVVPLELLIDAAFFNLFAISFKALFEQF